MKQFQFEYESNKGFSQDIARLKAWCKTHMSSAVIFHIYSYSLSMETNAEICKIIRNELPQAVILGCSSGGNIIDGKISDAPVSIVCSVYEDESTKCQLFFCNVDESGTELSKAVEQINKLEWVKGVEFLIGSSDIASDILAETLERLSDHISLFGGYAHNPDLSDRHALCFTSDEVYGLNSCILLAIGGESLHIKTSHIIGWKPLGKSFVATEVSGNIIKTLNNKPAYDVYDKYLNIKNDENFFMNTLEFPLIANRNGVSVMSVPIMCLDNGSIVMTSGVPENTSLNIAYGDPWTIMQDVKQCVTEVADFSPEAIILYSCVVRRTFWGDEESNRETGPFHAIAPTTGFYTSGEYLRTGHDVNKHNVTLVVMALREGDIINPIDTETEEIINNSFSGHISLVNRLTYFIEKTNRELEKKNRELEEVNHKLEEAAITDGLTKLYNRITIQSMIEAQVTDFNDYIVRRGVYENASNSDFLLRTGPSLIMLDIDNFKAVNDTYGHQEGDIVLIELAKCLKSITSEFTSDFAVGRWGGEEFMILLPSVDFTTLHNIAEAIRIGFSSINFEVSGSHTVSIGITTYDKLQPVTTDEMCTQVDNALYAAKRNGKNLVVSKLC